MPKIGMSRSTGSATVAVAAAAAVVVVIVIVILFGTNLLTVERAQVTNKGESFW